MHTKRILNLGMIFLLCCGGLGSLSPSPAAARQPVDSAAGLAGVPELQNSAAIEHVTLDPVAQAKPETETGNSLELSKVETFDMFTQDDATALLARGVIITPTALTGEGAAGTDVIYEMWVANRGSETDTFSIEMTSNWQATISSDTIGPLEPGEHAPLVLTVSVPADGIQGDFDTARVTAVSQGEPTKTSPATRITYVEWQAMEIAPVEAEATGSPGQTITYTVAITNITDITFVLTVTVDAAWETVAPTIVGPITSGDSLTCKIAVTIPADAVIGEADTALVTFVSPMPGAIDTVVTLTTRVASEYGLILSVDEDTQLVDHPPVFFPIYTSFDVNLTNIGTLTDTFALTVNSPWEANYMPLIGPIPPGTSQEVTIIFTLPMDVQNGDTNVAVVSFTSQGNPSIYQEVELTIIASWYELFLPMTIKL